MLKTNGVMRKAANKIDSQAKKMTRTCVFPVPNSTESYTKSELESLADSIVNYDNSIGNGGGSDSTMRKLHPALASWAGIKV